MTFRIMKKVKRSQIVINEVIINLLGKKVLPICI